MRLSPLIMNGYCDFHLENSKIHTVHFRTESIGVVGVKVWKLILDHIKVLKNPMKNGNQSVICLSLSTFPDLYLLIQDGFDN